MEIIVKNDNKVLEISDFDNVKKELAEKVCINELVINDYETYKNAKTIRASYNAQSKALNDTRLYYEKSIFGNLKNQFAELKNIIDSASSKVDTTIKTYELEQTNNKILELKNYLAKYNNIDVDYYINLLNETIDVSLVKNDLETCKLTLDSLILQDLNFTPYDINIHIAKQKDKIIIEKLLKEYKIEYTSKGGNK